MLIKYVLRVFFVAASVTKHYKEAASWNREIIKDVGMNEAVEGSHFNIPTTPERLAVKTTWFLWGFFILQLQ